MHEGLWQKGKKVPLDWWTQNYSEENSDHLESKLISGPGTLIISHSRDPEFVSILQMKRPRRKDIKIISWQLRVSMLQIWGSNSSPIPTVFPLHCLLKYYCCTPNSAQRPFQLVLLRRQSENRFKSEHLKKKVKTCPIAASQPDRLNSLLLSLITHP